MHPMPAPAAGAAPVIVTRPAADARHWVHELRQAGFAAEALPLIDIAAALDTGALARAWQTLDRYAACMFVSGNAVAYFFNSSLASGLPPTLRLMAPGPGTVAALLAAGVPAAQVDAPAADAGQFDSEALWAVVGQRDWQGKRVLVLRGESPDAAGGAVSSGRDWIARQWEAAGAQVDFVGVYQRRAPQFSEAQLARARAASKDGSVWLFSSSEALANLTHQPALAGVDWRGARAVATHPRIVDAVRAAGWGVVVASRPALTDIRETLASIESLYP
ncbi:uroporphyrinogen-III synthase [Polaromonas sp. JS666]|uniref:uroporphyrinogen-III synthase n=1 Tax=Polaromonas sp. (strain JS666 / ATCC BAA-500) TaxID=296591 RepID=UPI00087F6E22|nr:uroporphyrinogen-III synthase [Polaromonas sp. JS666]SDN34628.1 uroporphyrinogen-III synthase [Polaromonas sp. JS666]